MYQRPAKPLLPTRRCYASLAPERVHIAGATAETRASCGGSAKARTFGFLRALVFLRDGLTWDSTGRTIPNVSGATRWLEHLAAPTIHQAPGGPAHGYNLK